MNRLVSVILPVYNSEEYIKQSVQSVFDQSYVDWELIVINDGSKDGTKEYLQTIDDPKVHIINQENKGVSAARNVGLAIAKGEYITFLDADDALPTNSLKARVSVLEHNSHVDVVDGVVSVRDATLVHEIRRYQPYYNGSLMPRLLVLDDRVFFGPSYMVRKTMIEDTYFNEKMTHAEDLLFYMTLASKNNLQYSFADEVVYYYRQNLDSAMSNMDGLEKGYLELLKQVRFFKDVSFTDYAVLKLKTSKILFLSWGAIGQPYKGLRAASCALTC